jgi:soluble lytic murein transglycosylase-like protein
MTTFYDPYYDQPLGYIEIETPLTRSEYEYAAPARTLRLDADSQRTMVIFAAVLMVVAGLILARTRLGETTVAAAPPSVAQAPPVAEEAAPPAVPMPVAPTVQGAISPVFSPEVRHWEPQILAWSAEFGLDPNLAAIIMQIESCGDPQAVSGAGAQGLFQVMPFHFAAGEDSLNPDNNARRGLNYFVERLGQTNGDIGRAFAGYNGGHVAAGSSWDNWAHETQRYYVWSTGIYNDIQQGLADSPTLQQWMQAGGASLCRQAAQRLGLGS